MCGIVGYIGKNSAAPFVCDGLTALEYRGYDSAGIAILSQKKIHHFKEVGYVNKLQSKVLSSNVSGTIAIGHTRWATHGEPSVANAHPHADCKERISVVHNGIIENYQPLKKMLEKKGHKFLSSTDTEVVAHLLEEFLKGKGVSFKQALFETLRHIEGAYALLILDAKDDVIYAAKKSSPLLIGIGEGEYIIASDPSAVTQSTKNVVYLKDNEIAEIREGKLNLSNLLEQPVPIEVEKLEWTLEQAKKGDYDHFMLKEIFEAKDSINAAMRGRLKLDPAIIKLGGLELVKKKLRAATNIRILGCGTSYYAGLVAEYFFEEIAGVPTEVHIASEFRYRKDPVQENTVTIAISQSGETADTLAAVLKVKDRGELTLGVVNVVGSSIARATHAGVYNHAGPEIGVASTKAFLSQLTVLLLIALYLAQEKGKQNTKYLKELKKIPDLIELILKKAKEIKKLAKKYKKYENFLYIGRGYNFPVALEGALKLKEISYIHAEGYGAGEMKHGPIALISPETPTIAIAPLNSLTEKMHSNMEEIRSRKGKILAIATEGDERIKEIADDVFFIPPTLPFLEPFLSVVPLQLLAYYIGVEKGLNVDKPRNLAKSVTVE